MSNKNVFSDNPQELQTQIYGVYSNKPMPIHTDVNGNLLATVSTGTPDGNPYTVPLTARYDTRTSNLTPMAGWNFSYNINTALVTASTANGGTVSQSNNMAVLSTSTATNGSAKIVTRKILRCVPGLGALARFDAIFSTGTVNSQQLIGLGDDTDGIYFGYNATAFSILYIQNGTLNWVPQSSWNVDKMNGSGPSGMTLDTTKGNMYAIDFQSAGFGVINFYINSTTTGQAILVHRVQYPNTAILPLLYNPNFTLTAKVLNNGNTSDITLKTSSSMAFCEGDAFTQAIVTRNSINATVNFGSTAPTNQNVLTLLNTSTFASKTNKTRIRLDFISTANDATKPIAYQVVRNASFGTALTYTPINVNTSVIQYSSTLSTVSGGLQLMAFNTPINSGTHLFVSSLSIYAIPGDTLTIQATSTANNFSSSCSMSWEEEW